MKTSVIAAVAALGLWVAGSASVQGEASEKSLELMRPAATQSAESVRGAAVDRATVKALRRLAIEAGQSSSSAARTPRRSETALDAEKGAIGRHRTAFFERTYGKTATRVAGVFAPGADRHPPLATRFAGLRGPGSDRHPPVVTRFAEVKGPGADRHPPAVTRFAQLPRYGIDRHPPAATRLAGLTGQEPAVVVLQVGTARDDFALAPKVLRFDKGRLYKLVVVNAGRIKHYVSAPEFGDEINSSALSKGFELKPGDRYEWYFAADREGTYGIGCMQMEHVKAGMIGKIVVSAVMG